MPYDPALPTDNSPIASAEMRGQLTGLKEIIDAKVASVTGGAVANTDPANPVIRTSITAALSEEDIPFVLGVIEKHKALLAGG